MMTRVAMLLLAVFTSMGAWAESWDSGDCQVTLEGSTLTVCGSGAMRDFQSAEEVPWRTHKDNIKTVVVGNGVTHIGDFSFYGCESLESVTIPNSVTSIGNFAFYGCHGINSLTLPDNLTTIGNEAFYNCSAITTLNIPNSVTSIGNQAFWKCYSLICVTIGTGVTSIGYSAFEDCTHLATVVVFATSAPTLGNGNLNDVFKYNADGRYIYVPNGSLETFQTNWSDYSSAIYGYTGAGNCGKTSNDKVKWVFADMDGNSTGETMVIYGSGAMADYSSAANLPWKNYKSSITTLIIEEGVTTVGKLAFIECSNLTTVTFSGSSSVESIGLSAFNGCDLLTSITIPSSVTSIGEAAFENCTHLATVVVLATSVPTLGNENVFGNNASGRKIYVPHESWYDYDEAANWSDYRDDIDSFKETGDCGDNVKWLSSGIKMVVYGSGAMADYSSSGQGPWPHDTPKRVIIEEGVTTIGNYAFAGHGKTTHTVTIPNTVQTIGTNAFSGCSKIETLTIGSGVKTIGDHAFYNCHDINSLTLPDGVKTIGDHAFYNCHDINSLTLPDGVETIGDGAFFDCSSIPSVTIPSSVTRIGDYAFNGCSELATVTFAPTSSVTTIGEGAFNDCAKLESITIPSSVTSIGERVFGGCSKLTSISVESGNTVYDSGDGCNAIIKTSSHTLIAGCQNTTIPNTVTSIGNYAFDNISGLTSIEIPSSVTSLGEGAFYFCDLLASITIPSSVTSIGDNAFYGCVALSSVVILPASLTIYGKRVFEYNKSGRKIYVPNESLSSYKGVANWSAYSSAIYGYTGTGNCGKTSSDNVNWVFADMDGNSAGETMVIYGSGAMADYTQPDQAPWAKSFTTLNIEEGVTRIGNYAFQNCNGINTVNLPGKVTSIGNYAFDNAGLTSATLNSNPTIGGYAFGSGVALTMNLAASASNGYKWASFFNDYCNFQVDENTTVFKAKSNGEKVTLTAIADGIIPAGTAVVLRTPTDSSPVLTNTSSSTSGSYEDNELKGSSTAVTQEGTHTYYALAVKSGNVGLYKVKSSAKIPAGKAYLEDVIATTRDFLAFEDSEPTGIVDGRWKMEEGRGDGWYTLDGRKLNGKPKKKGMYVVNGNKVVIK